MKISLSVIPHALQRYDTLGDYWLDAEGVWQIRASDLGDWRYSFLILLHELVEFALLQHAGVSEQAVLDFDLSVPDASPYADDPGFDPLAPYHREHVLADTIERLVGLHLDVTTREVEQEAEKLEWKPPPLNKEQEAALLESLKQLNPAYFKRLDAWGAK